MLITEKYIEEILEEKDLQENIVFKDVGKPIVNYYTVKARLILDCFSKTKLHPVQKEVTTGIIFASREKVEGDFFYKGLKIINKLETWGVPKETKEFNRITLRTVDVISIKQGR